MVDMLKFWRRNKQEPTEPQPQDVRSEFAVEQKPEEAPVLEPEPEGPEPHPGPGPEAEPELPPVPVPTMAVEPDIMPPPSKKGWLSRLKEGLTKSTTKLTEGITGIFTKRKLDEEALEELEELLITADLGPTTAAKVTAELARTRFGKEITPDEVRRTLAASIAQILEPVAEPLELDEAAKPHVVLVVGVNGPGKTTTIGKMAKQFRQEGRSVMIAAGDTFRAAAVQQLQVWGERAGAPVVVAKETGADAAGLAFDALERARREKTDVLLIDTAGRLQNKANLMAELQKIIRWSRRSTPTRPIPCCWCWMRQPGRMLIRRSRCSARWSTCPA